MEMEQLLLTNQNGEQGKTYDVELCTDEIPFESVGDYILPDYQPEIRKLLLLSSQVLPSGKYENGGRAECGGSVKHTLVYSDAEGKTATAEFVSDYDYAYDGGSFAEGARLFGRERILSVSARLSGPRRLSIRTRMAGSLHLIGEGDASCAISGAPESETAVLRKRRSVLHTSLLESDIELSGEGDLAVASLEETRVLESVGDICIRDVRQQKDSVTVRGELFVRVLLSEGSGLPFVYPMRLPFEETLYLDEPNGECGLLPYGVLRSLQVSVTENGGGAAIFADASLSLSVELRENREISVVEDVYFTANETKAEKKRLSLVSHRGSEMGRFSVTGSLPKSECDAQWAVSVIETVGNAVLKSVEETENGVTLSGECKTRVLFAGTPKEDGEVSLFAADVSFPFTGTAEKKELLGASRYEGSAVLTAPRARLDGDMLYIDGELLYTVSAIDHTDCELLSSATAGERYAEKTPAVIRVYYPEGHESLWEIGKRYRVLPERLCEENALPEAVLKAPGKKEGLASVTRLFV